MLPFNTRAGYEETNPYKYKKSKNIDDIKAKVTELKQARLREKEDLEAVKRKKYLQGQTLMKKMHESILRDKGIVLGPGQTSGAMLPQGLNNNFLNKVALGYKVPRKFTLESLSKMNYGDFSMPNGSDNNDEFRPDDILDSDEDLDEEIQNMYHYKEQRGPQQNNSVIDINHGLQNSPLMGIGGGAKNRYQAVSSVNNSVANLNTKKISVNKNAYISNPPTSVKKRNTKELKINKSMVQNGRGGLNRSNLRGLKASTSRTRGSSVHKSVVNAYKNRSKSKPKQLLSVKNSRNKSSKNIHSDYSPNRRLKDKLKIGAQALKRTKEYDMKSKKKQEQKLNNVLKMQNYA